MAVPGARATVVRLGVCLILGLGSCQDLDPIVPPGGLIREAALSEASVPAQLPLRAPMGAPAREVATTATCGGVTVTAGRPERIRHTKCAEEYLVDFSVEADMADAPILDMFRSYPVVDWRVQRTTGRVRHELSLVWRPYEGADGSGGNVRWNARQVTRPLTVRACPDRGSVLACDDRRCREYASEDQVPPVVLPSQFVVVETPWSHEEVQDLREGSTLRVPVTVHLRPGGDANIAMQRFGRQSTREFAITPKRARATSRSGGRTVTFRVKAERDAVAQQPIVEEFAVHFLSGRGGGQCVVEPNRIRVRVSDR